MGLEQELDEAFRKARSDLGFPPISGWEEMAEEEKKKVGTAFVDMSESPKTVKINPDFASKLSDTAKKGLQGHEMGHPKFHPRSARNAIMEQYWAHEEGPPAREDEDQEDKEYQNPNALVNLFDDLVDNISLMRMRRAPQIEEIESLYQNTSEFTDQGITMEVIKKRYEEIADLMRGEETEGFDTYSDFGCELEGPDEEVNELLDTLRGIDFRWREVDDLHKFYFHEFAEAFDPYLEDMESKMQMPMPGAQGDSERDEDGDSSGSGDMVPEMDPEMDPEMGEGGGAGDEESEEEEGSAGEDGEEGMGEEDYSLIGDVNLDSFSDDQIEQGINEIAREEDIGPEEFDDITDVTEEQTGIGRGGKLQRALEESELTYYRSLANQYDLKIEGKVPNKKDEAPQGTEKWKPTDNAGDIDPVASLGQFGIPGVTKKERTEEFEMHGESEEGRPDATIVIDSSGSMTNPSEQTSYAVLGGFCAANSYIGNGSEVAVANFSEEMFTEGYTDDKSRVHKALLEHQADGTHVDIEKLERLENTKDGEKHTIFISDADISNMEATEEYLEGNEGHNTFIWINGSHDEIPEGYRHLEEIKDTEVYHVKDEEDIPEIVLGEVE